MKKKKAEVEHAIELTPEFMKTGVCWRYELIEVQTVRAVRSRKVDSCVRLLINVLELLGIIMNAHIMAL